MRSSPEFELIAKIRERLRAAGARGRRRPAAPRVRRRRRGHRPRRRHRDDASTPSSTGVHFRSSWCPPTSVGRKAMATALSDLAAMGAEPGEAYVWLGPAAVARREGVLELARRARGRRRGLRGGDRRRRSDRAPALAVSVTAVGHAPGPEELRRPLRGRAGRRRLRDRRARRRRRRADAARASGARRGRRIGGGGRRRRLQRQLDPRPRLAAGRALAAGGRERDDRHLRRPRRRRRAARRGLRRRRSRSSSRRCRWPGDG